MTQTNAKNEFTLEIDALSYGPYGIGRLDGKAVMIPNTAPGDKVVARIVEAKERYDVGEVVRFIDSSPVRQSPPCPYVNECGGCPWQHIRYHAQLKAKQQCVEDSLRRIGKLDGFDLCPIIPSPREYGYRRRIRLQLDHNKRLGFYRASSHRIVEIASCLIAAEEVNDCLASLRRWVGQFRAPLAQLEIVTGDQPGEIVVVAKFSGEFVPHDEELCHRLLQETSPIRGLVVTGRHWRRAWGHTKISVLTEDGIRSVADADVFTQVNPDGNRIVLGELISAGEFGGGDRALELYCGAGNFTLSIAKRVGEVVAVEGYRPSIEWGKLNAQVNGLENIHWTASHVPAAVERFAKRRERFSKIVLDPPRNGAKGIDRDLAALGAPKILYVSCNPTTLARDLSALTKHGYKLTRVQPIDLFPHTFHVEILAVMKRE